MIQIEKVQGKQGFKEFIAFPSSLYANDPNWIDPLFLEREEHLSKKNPASEHVEWQAWIAKKTVRLPDVSPLRLIRCTANFMARIPDTSA